MQKIIFTFLTLVMLLIATTTEAQIKVGVKAGVNDDLQKLNVDGTLGTLGLESESKIGFNVGVFAELGNGKVRFQPELSFTTRGSDRPGIFDTEASRKHKLTYVEIPLQAKWYFLDINEKFEFYGMSGLSFGFALSGKVEEDNQPGVDLDFDDNDPLDYNKRLDVGIPFAAGATMQLGEGKIFIEARYIFGLSKVQQTDESNTINYNAKNRTTQYNVGYIFSF